MDNGQWAGGEGQRPEGPTSPSRARGYEDCGAGKERSLWEAQKNKEEETEEALEGDYRIKGLHG
jgi:hypothetical protein